MADGPTFKTLNRAQKRTHHLEPGVSKVHWISVRFPMHWRHGVAFAVKAMGYAVDCWRKVLDIPVTIKKRRHRLESYLEPDYAKDAWVLSVGIPEGVNASDFYCTHLKPWEENAP